jgi:AcrR family transcriptional regulator
MASEVTSAPRSSARERLLAAANELFYAEGIHTVGIDRVIERAGVAKATLYNTFGSKDELIRAYLQGRHVRNEARIKRALERHDNPRDKLLSVFEAQAEMFAAPGYHGCAFVNASAEAEPGSVVDQVSGEQRQWLRSLFVELSRTAGVSEPEAFARRLHLLYDGAMLSARMDHETDASEAARAAAEIMLDAALAA